MKKILLLNILCIILSCNKNVDKITSIDNGNDSVVYTSNEEISKPLSSHTIDSSEIKKLKSLFIVKKDEFDSHAWIKPKSKPAYINRNGFYCYFAQNSNGSVDNFRFVGQYAADEWLFIKKLTFNIDGENYEYFPDNIDSDHETTIWEWYDDQITPTTLNIIEKISKAKNVKVRFTGSQYYDDKIMSQSNIKSIKNTFEYYKALGGSF